MTQAIRFHRLGWRPCDKSRLVNDETINAEEEIVVAKKIKHETQKRISINLFIGKVVINAA